MIAHPNASADAARERAVVLLKAASMLAAARRVGSSPHGISRVKRQRPLSVRGMPAYLVALPEGRWLQPRCPRAQSRAEGLEPFIAAAVQRPHKRRSARRRSGATSRSAVNVMPRFYRSLANPAPIRIGLAEEAEVIEQSGVVATETAHQTHDEQRITPPP